MGRFVDAVSDRSLLHLSPALAETLAETAARTGEPQFCLRRQRPYVLLGPQDMRLPDLSGGLRYIESAGIPARRRVGGGAAVLLDEDCLSFAAAIPCRDIGRLDRNFEELTAPVRTALQEIGVRAAFGRAEGSFCEGPQDLLDSTGRKVAGVAQALRRGYALVSGMILVSQDPTRTTSFLQEFYRASGSEKRLRADAVTSISRALGRSVGLEEVYSAIEGVLMRSLDWQMDGSLDSGERARAEQLLLERRMHPPDGSALAERAALP